MGEHYDRYNGMEELLATDINVATKDGTNLAEVGTDCISRQAATDALRKMQTYKLFSGDDMLLIDQAGAQTELMLLPPAQPELIEKAAYIRGFEQGRTQGMIDAQGGKK